MIGAMTTDAPPAEDGLPSYEEAVALVTADGARFTWHTEVVRGVTTRVFDRAPAHLRALWDAGRSRDDDVFLVYEDERWTFAEFLARVDALGALLVSELGVSKGDRIAIAMRNYPEWIVAFAAATSIGAIAVSLNAWWTEHELAYGLDDSGASLVIADVERIDRIGPELAGGALRALAVRWPAERPLPDGVERFEDRIGPLLAAGAAMPDIEIDPDDDATILYTSGTTGHPKGAVATHRGVCSALMAYACASAISTLRQRPDERAGNHPFARCYLLCVPLFHVTGCIAVMLNAWASGSRLVIMYRWNPERALELVERERVTMFIGVPTMSWDLLESPDFERRDTSSLYTVGGGGAPAPPELVRRIDSGFSKARPTIGYGMTETNAYGPGNSGDDYVRKPTSAGRVVPVVEVRVTDPDGNPRPAGEVGEIWFRGPHLIRGYWNRPEATAETLVDGWLRTGDLGRVDDEGFVYVEDRAKDMVLRAGENVYCAEVEAAIYEHPAVYEAAVFGVPHPRLGEEVAAIVLPRAGEHLDEAALVAHLAERVAPFKIPTVIRFASDQLPRNASGKILKRDLRDRIVDEAGPTG